MKLVDYLEKRQEYYPDFAKKIGVSLPALYKYASGKRTPAKKIMIKITKITKGEVDANSFYQ